MRSLFCGGQPVLTLSLRHPELIYYVSFRCATGQNPGLTIFLYFIQLSLPFIKTLTLLGLARQSLCSQIATDPEPNPDDALTSFPLF